MLALIINILNGSLSLLVLSFINTSIQQNTKSFVEFANVNERKKNEGKQLEQMKKRRFFCFHSNDVVDPPLILLFNFYSLFFIIISSFVSVSNGEVQIQRISDRIVNVPGGNVKGVIAAITDEGPLKNRFVEQFYGIQFASVPERFQPPERPTDQWQGNRILWNPAPACPGPEYGRGGDDLRDAGYNRVARARLEAIIAAAKAYDGDMYDWESTCLKMNIFVPYGETLLALLVDVDLHFFVFFLFNRKSDS